jgi:hypothetical protein
MAEPVRLVVWDLDETFWKGSVSEGGMREYVKAHHDTVIELARRGGVAVMTVELLPFQHAFAALAKPAAAAPSAA